MEREGFDDCAHKSVGGGYGVAKAAQAAGVCDSPCSTGPTAFHETLTVCIYQTNPSGGCEAVHLSENAVVTIGPQVSRFVDHGAFSYIGNRREPGQFCVLSAGVASLFVL